MSSERQLRLRAESHRRRLQGTVVVGVTGSCGKTTTVDLAAKLLGSRYRGQHSDGFWNCGLGVVHSLLAVRPDDDFFVQELGAWGPGTIDEGLRLVQPDIAVVTNLRNDHYSSFRGPVGAQVEKGKLVEYLPAGGKAVLNADDQRVMELASLAPGPTVSFGRGPLAALRASNVSATWPGRLSFRAAFEGREVAVTTQLVGEHLLGSALAAMGVGLCMGLTLEDAAIGLRDAHPTFRRMSPVELPQGVTFIRDDYKAPVDSVEDALEFMASARADRRIVVIGRISDHRGRSRPCYTRIAFKALAAADTVIFVGRRAAELWGEHRGTAATDQLALRRRLGLPPGRRSIGQDRQKAMLVFEKVRDASKFLGGYLRTGDLVLLKASGQADHLERVVLDRQLPVRCWLESCGRKESCDACRLVETPGLDEPDDMSCSS